MSVLDLSNEITVVANQTARRFGRWVSRNDVAGELWVYVLGPGKKACERWVDDGETNRLIRALFGVARLYAETEKAAQLGYSVDDLAWYSPEKLADLMPIVLDDEWDGLTGASDAEPGGGGKAGNEGGNLLAMVVDVRRALRASFGGDVFTPDHFDPLTDDGLARLRKLADRLGGDYPKAPGYHRRAQSNARAIARTRSEYDE